MSRFMPGRDCWSCIALCRQTEETESSSDSLFAPYRLNLLLRNPLQHTSTLNYLLPVPSHFKDRCTHHKPQHHLFIISSLFKPEGLVTGCWHTAHCGHFKKLATLPKRDVLLINLDNTHGGKHCVFPLCLDFKMTGVHIIMSPASDHLPSSLSLCLTAEEERSFLQWPAACSQHCCCI